MAEKWQDTADLFVFVIVIYFFFTFFLLSEGGVAVPVAAALASK